MGAAAHRTIVAKHAAIDQRPGRDTSSTRPFPLGSHKWPKTEVGGLSGKRPEEDAGPVVDAWIALRMNPYVETMDLNTQGRLPLFQQRFYHGLHVSVGHEHHQIVHPSTPLAKRSPSGTSLRHSFSAGCLSPCTVLVPPFSVRAKQSSSGSFATFRSTAEWVAHSTCPS